VFKARSVCPAILDSPFLRKQKFLNALHRRVLGLASAGGGKLVREWIDNGGFETGDYSDWDYVYAACEVVTSPKRTGNYASYLPYAGRIEQDIHYAGIPAVEELERIGGWGYRTSASVDYFNMTFWWEEGDSRGISTDFTITGGWERFDYKASLIMFGDGTKHISRVKVASGCVSYCDMYADDVSVFG